LFRQFLNKLDAQEFHRCITGNRIFAVIDFDSIGLKSYFLTIFVKEITETNKSMTDGLNIGLVDFGANTDFDTVLPP